MPNITQVPTIEIGNIATITLKCDFQGFQGEVIKIRNDSSGDNTGINFKDGRNSIFGAYESKTGVIWFNKDDIRPDNDWRFDEIILCKSIIDRETLEFLNTPVPKDSTCEHTDCDKRATNRIYINTSPGWTRFFSCPEHKKDNWAWIKYPFWCRA